MPAKEDKMAKKDYAFSLDGVSFDLSEKAPLPIKNKTNAQLAEIYNSMCQTASQIEDFDPKGTATSGVAKFKDSETGKKRIAALHSSVVAFARGQADEVKRSEKAAAKATKPEKAEGQKPQTKSAASDAKRGRPATYPLRTISIPAGAPVMRASTKRYAAYRDGMTVQQYVDEAVKNGRTADLALGDVRYDVVRGFITVSDAPAA
jgi:hypothetical protein